MLGGSDSGKTTLTSQFMSSNNVGGYINETIGNIKDWGKYSIGTAVGALIRGVQQ